MSKLPLLAAIAMVLAAPAWAKPTPHRAGRATAHPHARAHAAPRAAPRTTGEAPVDRGPFTPEANRAYQGGGVVLQGQPGGPAPMPQPTPPGQMPLNAVPPR